MAGRQLHEVDLPERAGVTYTQTTVIVPSDRQLIMIPSSIPVPVNCTIAAVLFAPENLQDIATGSSTDRDTAAESETPIGTTTAMVRVPPPYDQRGAFIQLLPTSSGAELSGDVSQQIPVSSPVHPLSAPVPEGMPLLTARRQSQISSIGNPEDLFDKDADNQASCPEDEGSDNELAASDNENNQTLISDELVSTPLSIEKSTKMLKRYREMAEESEVTKIKRPANSFIRYRSDFHKKAAANGDKRTADEISREAGRIWKTMSKEDRKPYQEPARVNMDVYKVKATGRKRAEMEMKKLAKKAISQSKGKGKGKGKAASSSRSHSFSSSTHTPGAGAGASSASTSGLGMHFAAGALNFSPVLAAGSTSFVSASSMESTSRGSVGGSSLVTIPPDFGHTIRNPNITSLVSRIPLTMAGSVEFMPSLFNEPMIMSVNTDASMSQNIQPQQVLVTVDPATNSSAHARIRAMSTASQGRHGAQSYYPVVGVQGTQSQQHAHTQIQIAAPVPVQAHTTSLAQAQVQAQAQSQAQAQALTQIQIPVQTQIHSQTPLQLPQSATPHQWDVNSFLGSISALNPATEIASSAAGANIFSEASFISGLSEHSAQTPALPLLTTQLVYPGNPSTENSPYQHAQGASPSVVGMSANTPSMLTGVFSPIPNIDLAEVNGPMSFGAYSVVQQQQQQQQQQKQPWPTA
ncbi:hypothetical protein LPJ75_002896 [Coemansia sp. RSA 2598]|nr:hypothetical protein LPJ75_002896 [Coemansia sp. RSA 2598]